MNELRGLALTFVVIGTIGIVGVKATNITKTDDRPELGSGEVHQDLIKRYDKNTLTTEQIEMCMGIKYQLDTLENKPTLSESERQKQNSFSKQWNTVCAGKRYYLDDYNSSNWSPT